MGLMARIARGLTRGSYMGGSGSTSGASGGNQGSLGGQAGGGRLANMARNGMREVSAVFARAGLIRRPTKGDQSLDR